MIFAVALVVYWRTTCDKQRCPLLCRSFLPKQPNEISQLKFAISELPTSTADLAKRSKRSGSKIIRAVMPCMYLPLNHFADFLIYVPDREDVVRGEDVYIFPRGAIAHNTGRSESALEPYKNAWHLLKETSPALFERKAEPLRKPRSVACLWHPRYFESLRCSTGYYELISFVHGCPLLVQ